MIIVAIFGLIVLFGCAWLLSVLDHRWGDRHWADFPTRCILLLGCLAGALVFLIGAGGICFGLVTGRW